MRKSCTFSWHEETLAGGDPGGSSIPVPSSIHRSDGGDSLRTVSQSGRLNFCALPWRIDTSKTHIVVEGVAWCHRHSVAAFFFFFFSPYAFLGFSLISLTPTRKRHPKDTGRNAALQVSEPCSLPSHCAFPLCQMFNLSARSYQISKYRWPLRCWGGTGTRMQAGTEPDIDVNWLPEWVVCITLMSAMCAAVHEFTFCMHSF